jgi:ASCH domain
MLTKPKSSLVRWSPKIEALPAITVRQPWAWLLVAGFKDIENRPRRTHHRGPILIHAGLNMRAVNETTRNEIARDHNIRMPNDLDVGGIIGVVDIVDCVEHHLSPWFFGEFGWIVANARRLAFRPCKGALGFFRPTFHHG